MPGIHGITSCADLGAEREAVEQALDGVRRAERGDGQFRRERGSGCRRRCRRRGRGTGDEDQRELGEAGVIHRQMILVAMVGVVAACGGPRAAVAPAPAPARAVRPGIEVLLSDSLSPGPRMPGSGW